MPPETRYTVESRDDRGALNGGARRRGGEAPPAFEEAYGARLLAEAERGTSLTSPFQVDVNQASDQFGLPAQQFDDLLANIIPGSECGI